METLTVGRTVAADQAAVREAIADREAFMRAGEFSTVTVDGDEIRLGQSFGLGRIELVQFDYLERLVGT